jgi:tRNA pseudouridine55 synthase
MIALSGWIIIDKPLGLGSTQGVAAVKRALRDGGYAKVKVGHGGTLDPLATGVLPIAIGEATKLAGRMLDASKVYDFTIGFGEQTDTLDGEGSVVATSEVRPTLGEVRAVLPVFTGEIEQVPPAYSALKVDGQRAYDLARGGEEVVLAMRRVMIHSLAPFPSLTALAFPSPDGRGKDAEGGEGEGALASITLTAHVSKGTYIRSLARDVALALGTVGHVRMLRRTRAGPFGLGAAISLDKLADAAIRRSLEDVILPLTAGLDGIPALTIDAAEAMALRQGKPIAGKDTGLHIATFGSTPIALVDGDGTALRVVRGFNH